MSVTLTSESVTFNVKSPRVTYPTIADMQNETASTEGDYATVIEDGRGGDFVYRGSNSEVDNGGTIFDGWTRVYDGAVNVKWFGADGTTVKNTNALQSCLDVGGLINIDFQQFDITEVTVTKNNTTIYGAGKGRGTVIHSDETDGVMITSISYNFSMQNINIEGSSSPTEKGDDITLIGIKYSQPDGNADSYLNNVGFRYLNKCIDQQARNIEGSNVTFSNSATGVYIGVGVASGATDSSIRGLVLANSRFHSMTKNGASGACINAVPSVDFHDVVISGLVDDCGYFMIGFAGNTLLHDIVCVRARNEFVSISCSSTLEVSKRLFSINSVEYSQASPTVIEANALSIFGSTISTININGFVSNRSGGHGIYVDSPYVRLSNINIYNAGMFDDDTYSGVYLGTAADLVHMSNITVMQDRIETPVNKMKYGFEIYGHATRGNKLRVDNLPSNEMYISDLARYDGEEPRNQERHIKYGGAAPVSGVWSFGDRVYDFTPSAGGSMGWVCTSSGTPGTWKTFGTIGS